MCVNRKVRVNSVQLELRTIVDKHGPDAVLLALVREQPPEWALRWVRRLALLAWRRINRDPIGGDGGGTES